jgi:hypothetical protein
MNAEDFRRIALSFEGAKEGSHMGSRDFRVDGRIFATLAAEDQGYGNLMLSPEQQADFVRELPEVFLPIPGGWGRMGMTHVRLSEASEDVLTGALHAAWRRRVEKNQKAKARKKTNRRRLRSH